MKDDIFDPYDMDREEFDPHMCMVRYTKDCDLPLMLSRRFHLESEICRLSCDLKNLHLDNYTKFLRASSVVSRVRSDLEKMDDEVNLLEARMDCIGETSVAVLSKLRPSQKRLSRLVRGQDALRELHPLIELVPALKRRVESGAYTSAAKHYLKVEPLLKKYRHLTSLEDIARDSADVVLDVKSGLLDTLDCGAYRMEELSEKANLLLSLGETPVSVADHFLSSSRKYLTFHLSPIEDACMKGHQKRNINNQPEIHCVGLCCGHIEKVERIISVTKEIFIPKCDQNTKNSVEHLMNEFFLQSFNQLSCQLQQRIIEHFQSTDDDFLSQILDKFIRQCHKSGIVTPQINFHKTGMDAVVRICSARYEFHLENMQDNFDVTRMNIEEELSPTVDVRKSLNFLVEWTELQLSDVLKSVTYYMRPEFRCCRDASFRNALQKILASEGILSAFLRYINNKIWIAMTSKEQKQCNDSFVCLFYAKYFLEIKEKVIPMFLIKIEEYLGPCESRILSSDADIATVYSSTSQKLVKYYSNNRSLSMTCMIHKSFDSQNWLECKEPTHPRPVIKLIFNELQDIKSETERVFGPSENPRGRKNSPRPKEIGNPVLSRANSVDSLSDQNLIEKRILLNKLFKDYSSKPRRVKFNTYSILSWILEKILKSFIEYVRMKTFNCFGLQQIQIDVCALKYSTSKLLDYDDSSFQVFLDEILSSAFNRSVDAEFMNDQLVSVICNETF